jgi:hypothetical protein
MKYAALASCAWVIVVVVYALINWIDFRNLQPNEMGDLFAGVFAPLAFLWLVVGYFQQSDELRFQAEQLRLQVGESKNLVREAARQAEASASLLDVEREKHREDMRRNLVSAQPNLQHSGHSTSAAKGLIKLTTAAKTVASGDIVQLDCMKDEAGAWDFQIEMTYYDGSLRPRKAWVNCKGESVEVYTEPVVLEQLL